MVLMSFNMVLIGILEFFGKMIKWDELGEILELIGIGLWCVYAYAIVIICNMCVWFVEMFEHVWLGFDALLRKCWKLWK